MSTKDFTVFDYTVAAIMGVINVDEGIRIKHRKYTLDINRTYFEDDNSRSFAIRINGAYMAVVWPEYGTANVVADDRVAVDFIVDRLIAQAFNRAGWVNTGSEYDSMVVGKAQVWRRKPPMYLTTTDEPYPASVDGRHRYDPNGIAWSNHHSVAVPGESGHDCTMHIPPAQKGYVTWSVDYTWPHEYATSKIGTIHTFGSVRLLHRVHQEPEWRKGTFSIDDGPSFEGYTRGDRWNGAACPFFTHDVAQSVIEWALSTRDDKEISPDHEENYDLVMPEATDSPFGPVYSIGGWSWTWYEEE